MKKSTGDCFIVGIGSEDHEYVINGVKYIVSSRYAPTVVNSEGEHTLSDRLKNYVKSDFSDLTETGSDCMLGDEYAFSTAGEED